MAKYIQPEIKTQAGPVSPRLDRLMLVLEGNEKGAWVIPVLPIYLPHSGITCNMVQVMDDVSHGGWLQADPETFWNAISLRRHELEKSRGELRETLRNYGLNPVKDEVTDTSHEGQENLLREIEAEPYELLVIGCRNPQMAEEEKPYQSPVSGYAGYLAGHSTSSVLMLKKPPKILNGRLKVMFATDGTEASARAAGRVSRYLRADNTDITIITVLNPVYMENPIIAPYVNVPAIDEAFNQNGRLILETTRGILESQGLTVTREYFTLGSPVWELLDQIEREDPDLVVVGSHNRQGVAAWFLGSVSQRVVQTTRQSVLLIR